MSHRWVELQLQKANARLSARVRYLRLAVRLGGRSCPTRRSLSGGILGAKFPIRASLTHVVSFLFFPISGHRIRREDDAVDDHGEKAFPGATTSSRWWPSRLLGGCGSVMDGAESEHDEGNARSVPREREKFLCRRFNFPHRIRFYFSLAPLSE